MKVRFVSHVTVIHLAHDYMLLVLYVLYHVHVVDSMNMAAKYLYGNLTEKEKFAAERKAYKAIQHHDIQRRNFKERIKKFGEDAIKGNNVNQINGIVLHK